MKPKEVEGGTDLTVTYKPDKSIIKYLDTLKSFHKEILIESNFFALNKECLSVPQFALYSNFSMTHTVNQYSFDF